MPTLRPAPAPVRPPAAHGGGASRPAGQPTSNGASCAVNGFAPGTQMQMADCFTAPIELGEEVWAADPETGEAGARPVTALIEGSGEKDLVTVSTESGSVVATAGHPFWSVSDAAWVDAGGLSVGDAVLEADGASSVVTEVSHERVVARVVNLTVAAIHTYFVVVGDAPTLVHNCGGDRRPFALGLGDHLDDFASRHGAETYKDLADPTQWQAGVLERLGDPTQRVLFNLDGVDNVMSAVQRAATGRGGATDWELLQVRVGGYRNVEFWKDGVPVESPF